MADDVQEEPDVRETGHLGLKARESLRALSSNKDSEEWEDEWVAVAAPDAPPQNGENACICGRPIKYVFYLRNTKTGANVSMGSVCINEAFENNRRLVFRVLRRCVFCGRGMSRASQKRIHVSCIDKCRPALVASAEVPVLLRVGALIAGTTFIAANQDELADYCVPHARAPAAPPMGDDDIMPYGKHMGKRAGALPASYWEFIGEKLVRGAHEEPELADVIKAYVMGRGGGDDSTAVATTMPFGKEQGKPLEEVSSRSLSWIVAHLGSNPYRSGLVRRCKEILEQRKDEKKKTKKKQKPPQNADEAASWPEF